MLRKLGIADEGPVQLIVDSRFESLASGNVHDAGKVQPDWEIHRHACESMLTIALVLWSVLLSLHQAWTIIEGAHDA